MNWEREREKERALVTTLSASHERVLIHIKTHTPTLRNQTVRSVHQTESMQPGSVLHVPVTTAMHAGLHTQPQQREKLYYLRGVHATRRRLSDVSVLQKKLCKSSLL